MKRFGLVLLATGLAGFAHAADLPTAKPPEAAPPSNCWSSFWNWLNSSSYDCPLTYRGITLYGALDLNAAYLSAGVGYSPSADKINYGIQKNAYASRWIAGYNGLSTSVLGLAMKEGLGPVGLPDWSLVGVLEAGFNPYSGMLDNGPRSLADNNAKPAGKYPWQTTNFDGSRAGQWDNSQGYIGVSHPVYGTLTFGRTNTLSFDVVAAYDPTASVGFSLLGFSNAFAGFGATETVRPNTAFTYRLTYRNFHAAAQGQIGGYDWGNGSQGIYQGQIGADFGPLSLDGVVSWAKDAVSLSSFGGSNVACVNPADCFIEVNNAYYDPNSVLKATLSNNTGVELVAKYKWNTVTFYAGYLYANLANPSDDYLAGFPSIAQGIFVPPGYWSKGVYTNAAVTDNAYNINRKLNTVWTGFKWSVWSNLTFGMGFYYQSQNNYNFTVSTSGLTTPAACTGTGAFISSSKCAGSQDAVSLLIDYRPVGRVDLYAGVMLSNVYGGFANGYTSTYTYYAPEPHGKIFAATATTAHTQEYDPTVGIRIRF